LAFADAGAYIYANNSPGVTYGVPASIVQGAVRGFEYPPGLITGLSQFNTGATIVVTEINPLASSTLYWSGVIVSYTV
jgi:hypothetical protein